MKNKFFTATNLLLGVWVSSMLVFGHFMFKNLGWQLVFVPLGLLAIFGIGYIVNKIFKID